MTSCNEFTWPPVFTGSCLLFKMSFSCRSSPRALYRFSPRAQSCSEYTMVWQDTSECLFKHLMRVKRIIRIRWWRSIKKNLILFTVIYYIFSRFTDSRTQYFPTHGQAPRRFPSPSAFSSGTAQPPAKRWRAAAASNKKNYTKTEICQPTNKRFMYFTILVPWGESRATQQGAGLVGKASINSSIRHHQRNNKSLWELLWALMWKPLLTF